MKDRPTPETDAARHDMTEYGSPVPCSWGDWVHVDVASKLERERDEAREERDKLKQLLSADAERVDAYLGACIERDEAREALADWENAAAHVEADHPDEKHCGCVAILRKLLNDARSERDEANKELHKQLVRFDELFAEAEKIRIDRDEARAVASELSDIASKHLSFLLAITPTSPNDTHEKETKKVIDALKRWKKL
jgi:hypothetical protein